MRRTNQEIAPQRSENTEAAPLATESFNPATARPLDMGQGEVTIAGRRESFRYELKHPVDGIAHLVVEASDKAAHAFGSVAVGIAALMRRPAVAVTAASLALGAASETSKGSLIQDYVNPNDSMAMGADQSTKGSIFLHGTLQGLNFHDSAVLLSPHWAATSAHNIQTPNGMASIDFLGEGTNYTTPTVTAPVSQIYINPAYDGTFFSPDIALIHLSSALPGSLFPTDDPSVLVQPELENEVSAT